MSESTREGAEQQIRQLEARIAHQQLLAAQLAHHGYKGAADAALVLVATLRSRVTHTVSRLLAA